jgi:LPS-assembly protein
MTGNAMRNLSVGATLSVLLIVGMLLLGPLSQSVVAQPGITVGFALGGSGLITTSEDAEAFGRYLESQISIPVKVRNFATEEALYDGLGRFHEVDAAWLSKDFLSEIHTGQFSTLAINLDHSPELLPGEFVAKKDLNAALFQQMRTALQGMNENPAGRLLLSKIGTSRFVSPGQGQVTAIGHVATEPSDSPPESSPLAEISSRMSDQALSHDQIISNNNLVAEPKVVLSEELPETVVTQESDQATAAAPAAKNDRKEQIVLVADYLAYSSAEDSYEARGDVILSQAGVELRSEELLWQAVTQDVAAEGDVQLNDAGTEVSGASMQYNMATGQGQVRGGQMFVHQGNFHISGEQIEKRGQADYFVKHGSFTTCDGEVPDWKFAASEVDVTLGGYARAKHVWFLVKDVPVLYTPYMAFPVKTERETGLLAPSFGYSNNKGTMASLAWYKVIDRSMDATVYLDYLSDVGLGKGLEYRYALAHQNNGKALYYNVTGLKGTPNLYYLEWGHRGYLPGGWRLTADVEYTDDKLFFEEFGETAAEYNRDKTVSTLMLQRNWQKLNLVGYGRYVKDLEVDNFDSLQRLPEIGLGLARYRLGDTPLYVGLESYATHFSRDDGEDGERLFLKPSLSAVFKPGSWLELVPQVALYERLYNVDDRDNGQTVPEFSLGLATQMVRAFEVDRWGIERIQHGVEPKVVYTYVPNVSQDDLPLFDLYDRNERQNNVAYAVVNRLTARSTAADGSRVYREVLNLRLSQDYDFDEARNNLSGNDQPFSDVRVELDVRPTTKVALHAESRLPVYGSTRFRTLTVGASARDDAGNAVNIDYSYKNVDFSDVATDYINVKLDTSLMKPVYARFEERYDFRDKRELEKVVGLEYRSKCWSILLSYRNRYREFGQDDQEVLVTFVLAGIGMNQGFGSRF